MQVSYNGFNGELVKLEKTNCGAIGEFGRPVPALRSPFYDLSIYDSEKQVTHSFTGAKLEDVKFLGGAVAFGG